MKQITDAGANIQLTVLPSAVVDSVKLQLQNGSYDSTACFKVNERLIKMDLPYNHPSLPSVSILYGEW